MTKAGNHSNWERRVLTIAELSEDFVTGGSGPLNPPPWLATPVSGCRLCICVLLFPRPPVAHSSC